MNRHKIFIPLSIVIMISLFVYFGTYHHGSFHPDLPSTFDQWEAIIALMIVSVAKLMRGWVMCRRSTNIDRFGLSIILFDVIFGSALLITVIWTIWPATAFSIWFTRIISTSVLLVATWQLIEVTRASRVRIHRAVGPVEPFGTDAAAYDGEERRRYERRSSTRALKRELEECLSRETVAETRTVTENAQ